LSIDTIDVHSISTIFILHIHLKEISYQ